MNEPQPLSIVPGRTDKELAEDFRKRAIEVLAPVIELMNEAKRAGFDLGFQIDNGQSRVDGKRALAMLMLTKSY